VEDFFTIYKHLKRPSTLPLVSDYHIFKKGIRPVWEDEENKKGGKWIVRLKKGVGGSLLGGLTLRIIGDQFAEASEEVLRSGIECQKWRRYPQHLDSQRWRPSPEDQVRCIAKPLV